MLFRFLTLSFYQKRLLLCSWIVASAIRIGLYILPYRWLYRLPNLIEGEKRKTSTDIEQIIWAIRTSCRFVPKATCLTQAITAAIMLNYNGHRSNVVLGVVSNSSDSFEAHAWVESDGKIIVGKVKGMARYVILEPPKKATL